MIQYESGEWECYETLCERDSRAQHGAIVKYLYISVFIWFIVYMCSLNILNINLLHEWQSEREYYSLMRGRERYCSAQWLRLLIRVVLTMLPVNLMIVLRTLMVMLHVLPVSPIFCKFVIPILCLYLDTRRYLMREGG